MTRVRLRHPVLPTLDVLDVGWMELAACAGTSIFLWFRPNTDDDQRVRETEGTRHRRERRAKAFCHSCPVRPECLAWAFEVDGKGDWFAVRRRMRRNERRKVAR